jgi:glutaredoxin
MKFAPFLCASLLLALAAPASAEIYRWVDNAGRVHFGDQPPGDIDRVQQLPKQTLPDNTEAAKMRQAASKTPVTLYITDCGAPCSQASALLQERGIPFTTRLVDKDPEAAKSLRQLVGQLQVPTLKIGDNAQKGFEKALWNNLLDLAGYPRAKGASNDKSAPEKAKAKTGN